MFFYNLNGVTIGLVNNRTSLNLKKLNETKPDVRIFLLEDGTYKVESDELTILPGIYTPKCEYNTLYLELNKHISIEL